MKAWRFFGCLVSVITCFCFSKAYGIIPVDQGCLVLKGEYLYLKPFLENTNFVSSDASGATNPPAPTGYDMQNIPGYHSGYRGEVAYVFCNRDYISLAGTYFKNSSSKSAIAEAGALLPTQGLGMFLGSPTLAFASSAVDLKFYNIELLYNRPIYVCSPLTLVLKAGVEYAHINFDESIVYMQTTTGISSFENISRARGVGPEIALDWQWRLLCASCGYFSLNGCFKGSLLASYIKARHVGIYNVGSIAGPPEFPDVRRANWIMSPVWLVSFGLNYVFTNFRFNPTLEVGCKLANYYKAIEKLFFASFAGGASFVNEAEYSSLGLFAPYISLQISF